MIAGATVGAILAFGTSSAHGRDLVRARYPGFGVSFLYPAAWQRENWCWEGNHLFPLTLLTTARQTPSCEQNTLFGEGTPLPPQLEIGKNGVIAWWLAADRAGSARFRPNWHVDGRRARIADRRESTRRTSRSYVNCVGAGGTQRFLTALIEGPSSTVHEVQLGAVICGPDFAAGEAEVRRMLASLRLAP